MSLIEVDLSNQKSKPKIKKLKNSKARSFILLHGEGHASNTSFGDTQCLTTEGEPLPDQANFQTLLASMASNSSLLNLKKKPRKRKKGKKRRRKRVEIDPRTQCGPESKVKTTVPERELFVRPQVPR